jgi:hypothetical protein
MFFKWIYRFQNAMTNTIQCNEVAAHFSETRARIVFSTRAFRFTMLRSVRGRLHVRFCVRIGGQIRVRFAAKGSLKLIFDLFLMKCVDRPL